MGIKNVIQYVHLYEMVFQMRAQIILGYKLFTVKSDTVKDIEEGQFISFVGQHPNNKIPNKQVRGYNVWKFKFETIVFSISS